MNRRDLCTISLAALLIGPAMASAQSASETAVQVAQAASLPALEEMTTERSIGSPDAPVVIIEYASLTCPHCASFHEETWPQLKEDYVDTGKVRLVFHDFPLNQPALAGAMAARCLPEPQYFRMIDALFKSQSQWSGSLDTLATMAALMGLDREAFDACLQNEPLAEHIIGAARQASIDFGIRSTPSFVFNDGIQSVAGARSYSEFADIIDDLLDQ